jgi:hypothetical protein
MLSEERYLLKGKPYVIIALVLTILRFLIVSKEEVQRCTLDLGDRMKAPQRDNGDRLCIVPVLSSIIAAYCDRELKKLTKRPSSKALWSTPLPT